MDINAIREFINAVIVCLNLGLSWAVSEEIEGMATGVQVRV